MKTPRVYSPQLDRDLVRILYYEARSRGVPMTALATKLINEGFVFERVRMHSPVPHITR